MSVLGNDAQFGVFAHQLVITGLPQDAGLVAQAAPATGSPGLKATAVQDRGHLTPNSDGTWTFAPNDHYFLVAGDYRVDLRYVASDGVNLSQEPATATIFVNNTAPQLDAPDRVIIGYDFDGVSSTVSFPLDAVDADGDTLFVREQRPGTNFQVNVSLNGELTAGGFTVGFIPPTGNIARSTNEYFYVSDGFSRSRIATHTVHDSPKESSLRKCLDRGLGKQRSLFAGDNGQPVASDGWVGSAEILQNGLNQSSLESFGSINADLSRGDIKVSESLDADLQAGDVSPYALVYDSSLAEPNPILRATIEREETGTPITQIEVTANWYRYNESNDLTSLPYQRTVTFDDAVALQALTDDPNFLFEIAFDDWNEASGLYRWTLDAIMTLQGGDKRGVAFAGDAVIQRQNQTSDGPFSGLGAGWGVSGIPYLQPFELFDDPNPTNAIDDVAILVTADGGWRLFEGIKDLNNVKTFQAVDPATRVREREEFGTLTRDSTSGGTEEWTYTLPDGTTWQFRSDGLPISVTPPDGPSTTFTFDAAGRIESITTPDNGVTTFDYGGVDYLDRILLPTSGGVRELDVTVTGDQLTGLSYTGDYVRSFGYEPMTNLLNLDTIGTEADGVITTSVTYDSRDLLSRITLGTGAAESAAYAIESGLIIAGTRIQPASNGDWSGLIAGTPSASVRELFAAGETQGSDLQTYTGTQGTDFTGAQHTEFHYDERGRLLQRDDIVTAGTVSETTRQRWIRNAHGQVIRFVDGEVIREDNGTVIDQTAGRETVFSYDYDDQSQIYGKIDTIILNGDENSDEFYPTVPDILQKEEPRPVLSGNLTELYADYTIGRYAYDDFGYLISETDALGRLTTYTRDSKHRVTQIDAPLGYRETWEYGTFNGVEDVLLTYTDALGLTTRYEYDPQRRVTKATTGEGTFANDTFTGFVTPLDLLVVTTFDYAGGHGNALQIETEDGNGTIFVTTARTYDAQNRLLTETVTDGTYSANPLSESIIEYYDSGLVQGTHDGRQFEGEDVYTVFEYDTQGRQTQLLENARFNAGAPVTTGARISTTDYYKGGLVKTFTGPNEEPVNFFYDPLDRLDWVVTTGITALANGTSVSTHAVRSKRDQFGRVIETDDLLTGASSRFEYDRQDRLLMATQEEVVLDIGGPKSDIVSTFNYDAFGRILQEQSGLSRQSGTTDELSPSLAAQHYEYNELGYLVFSQVVAPGGASFDFTTDVLGNVLTATEHRLTPNGSQFDRDLFTTTSEYDTFSRITRSSQPIDPDGTAGQEFIHTTFNYSDIGRESTVAWVDDPANPQTTYTTTTTLVDGLGRQRQQDNQDDSRQRWAFNAAGDLTEVFLDFDSGVADDPALANFRRSYFEYDPFGRMALTAQAATASGTDNNDLVVQTTYVDSQATTGVSSVSTSNQTLKSILDSTPQNVPVTTIFTDAEGRTLRIEQPDADGPSSNIHGSLITDFTYDYDDAERTVRTSITDPLRTRRQDANLRGEVLATYEKTQSSTATGIDLTETIYDAAGRLTQRLTRRSQSPDVFDWTKYAYDLATGQPITVQDGNTQSGPSSTTSAKYDSAGNRVFVEMPPSDISAPKDNEITLTYDGLGRVLTDRTRIDFFDPGTANFTHSDFAEREWRYNSLAAAYQDRDGQLILTVADPATNQQYEYWFDGTATLDDLDDVAAFSDVVTLTQTHPFTQRFVTTLNPDGGISAAESFAVGGTHSVDTAITYDVYGRLNSESQSGTALGTVLPDIQLTSTWHDVGTRETLTVGLDTTPSNPSTFTTISTFTQYVDNLGRVTGLAQDLNAGQTSSMWIGNAPGIAKAVEYTYYEDGQLESIHRLKTNTLPDPTADSAGFTYFSYTADTGRLFQIKHFQAKPATLPTALDGDIADHLVTHDPFGRISLRRTLLFAGDGTTSDLQERLRYTYGDDGRLELTEREDPFGSASYDIIDDPDYDSAGNIANRNGVDYTVGYDNRVLRDADYDYAYDAEGRLVRQVAHTAQSTHEVVYTYDRRGRLTEAEFFNAQAFSFLKVEYDYDALGRRIAETITRPGETEQRAFIYDGSNMITELDISGTEAEIESMHLIGPHGERLASDETVVLQVDPTLYGTETFWAFADLNGSVATWATVDGQENFENHHQIFSSFGNTISNYGSTDSKFVVPDKIWNGNVLRENAFYEIGGRFYRASAYRFLTPGTVSLEQPNAYLLGGNDPLNRGIRVDWTAIEGPGPFSGVIGNTVGRGTYAVFGQNLVNASNSDLYIGTGFLAAGIYAAGVAAVGSLPLFATGAAAAEASYFTAAASTVAYTSLGVSSAQLYFSGGQEGRLNFAFDAFGVGFLRYANTARGLIRSGLFATDIGLNATQGVLGTTGAIASFRQGNYIGGTLSATAGLLGFAGAGIGSRNLAQLLRTDPFANPLNYQLSVDTLVINGGLFFGNSRLRFTASSAFADIAEFRVRNGLPAFDVNDPSTGTVSRILLNGEPFFGQNGAASDVPAAIRRAFVQAAGKNPKLRSANHAEAIGLLEASGEIVTSGTKRVTIFVDRPSCFACQHDGVLPALKDLLELDELVVVDSLGGIFSL